jgi:multidrug efflux pump subunit AcrA (membrane-fusion protein)
VNRTLWIAALLALVAGCHKSEAQAPVMPAPKVITTRAVAEDAPLYLDEIGRCTARERVSIQPQVSGRITQIQFTDGAVV